MSRPFVDCKITAEWVTILIGKEKKRWVDIDHVFETKNNDLHEELKKIGVNHHDDRQAIIDKCREKRPKEKKQEKEDTEEKKEKIIYALQQKHGDLTPLALEVLMQLTQKNRREATENDGSTNPPEKEAEAIT